MVKKKAKTEMITVKVTPQIYAQYQAACEMRGGSMAGLLHIFMVKTIHEEAARDPATFGQILARIYQRFAEKGIAANDAP